LTTRLSASGGADFGQIPRSTKERWRSDRARSHGAALIACVEAMAAGHTCWRHHCGHHNIVAMGTQTGLLILAILHERMDPAIGISARGRP